MSKNVLSKYTKDEILNAIESECDYITRRRLASLCELERAKQDEKKYAENLKRVEQTKQAYLNERDRLIAKYGGIDKIPPEEAMRLYSLQLKFLTAINED